MMKLKVGDRVVYSSAAQLNTRSIVKSIDIDKNAAGDYIPWITLEFDNPKYGVYPHAPEKATARLAYIESNLAMMKVKKMEIVA